ncbi:UvrB/UvrC motif-containing protein [Bacillus haynesii]|uniref:UVR domain-containing protein n=1 Tax=Bacillus haynesii TaxID=1925021 RepID=A0ABX3HZM4_9BACI|nr:UvrB/UvrC motif-containing protein [Bacillus haynesii]EWH23344.1 hypothetical protein M769_0102735 [Bacillus haynesii]MCI4129914.1 UvrB/UvrC motif-containing protein [Bacillus haynesii]OMI24677.1 hypothetical protein BTA31_21865 [Bacillus haynesii]
MICQECKERPATFHFTKVINGEKKEMHICEQCAKENSESYSMNESGGFSIHNLLSGLLNFDSSFTNSSEAQLFQQPDQVLRCKKCNMTFPEFRKTGRFGCSECYKTFHSYITPVLRKVHSGNTVHAGKIPKRIGGNLHVRRQVEALKKELKELIQQEEFEKAANIRDQIRSLEQNLNANKEEED